MSAKTAAVSQYPWPNSQPLPALQDLNGVVETASYLRCGRTYVFNLIREGHLRSVKVGRKRLIPATAIRAYVEGLS